MLYLQDGGYPALGASPPARSRAYALAKNAPQERFCLRRAHSLRLDTLAFEPAYLSLRVKSKRTDTHKGYPSFLKWWR